MHFTKTSRVEKLHVLIVGFFKTGFYKNTIVNHIQVPMVPTLSQKKSK
jgi:hypothetical protein